MNGEATIHKVQQTDSGMYQCIAENKYGAIYSNAELKILGNHVWCIICLPKHSIKREKMQIFLGNFPFRHENSRHKNNI